MRTQSQIEASRRNGAQSRGPATPAGKAASSQNAVTHGIYAANTVLASESQADYDELRETFLDRFCPTDYVEVELIDGMVKTRWLIRRLDRVITTALDFEVDRSIPQISREIENPDADAFQLRAHEVLTDNRRLEAWTRMQETLERRFDRYLRNLTRLQKAREKNQAPQNHENEPKRSFKQAESPKQSDRENASAGPASQNSQNEPKQRESQAPLTPRNQENEPKLISINEAIRRGLIPSLSPHSASRPTPAPKSGTDA
jgi:hypothetical protein